ncbi:MAG TPA: hypothetical protein H9786_04540 [Candidatus Brachybacterium merdavium]|uniref:ABC-2 type transport system permease protein n=1 Tax=Candidatus Brachybacterium merdavium TaxID=2838513 RepID=A0A9D2LBW2_9MICO|nr:hypothetical protein [Candidatus Brachybacterium merdavium]
MVGVLSSEHAATAAASDVRRRSITQRELIPLMLTLKWRLWKRSYRKNIGKLIGTVFGALYGIGGLVGLAFLFLGTTLWSGEGEVFPLIIRGLGSVTVLLWLLIPVLAFGVDDTLDPRSFALFPRSARELQPGMFAAAAMSLPTLFTVLAVGVATAFEVLWLVVYGQGPVWIVAALVVLVPANLAAVALCLLLPRAWFAHSASRSSSRSGRELGGIVAMIVMFIAIYGFSLGMQSLDGIDVEQLVRWAPIAVEVAAWTPLGAPFAVPMDLAEGRALTAAARTLISAVSLVVVWRWWRRSIDVALTSALSGDASSGTTKVSPLVPRFVRPSAFGAVLGRSLRYWRRDTRYLAAIGIYPVMLIFLTAMGFMLPETRAMMLTIVVMMGGFTSISVANEIGYDGPAGWVNITAGLPARANLLGRIAAIAIIMGPPVLLITAIVPALYGMGQLVPLTMLGALGMMLTGWGLSLLVGVLLPYPTSAPGTNPMKDKSASSGNAMLAMTIASLGLFVPQLPAIGVATWGLITGDLTIQLIAGAMSVLLGAVAFVVGAKIATRRLDRRYPDLFQKVRSHV